MNAEPAEPQGASAVAGVDDIEVADDQKPWTEVGDEVDAVWTDKP